MIFPSQFSWLHLSQSQMLFWSEFCSHYKYNFAYILEDFGGLLSAFSNQKQDCNFYYSIFLTRKKQMTDNFLQGWFLTESSWFQLIKFLQKIVSFSGRILPEPEESINLSMSQPKELKEKSEKSLSKIKDLFKLELLLRLL